jgi:hypothetical protein
MSNQPITAKTMRECRQDFMAAAREFRQQGRPATWVRAQVRWARRANRHLVEMLQEQRVRT